MVLSNRIHVGSRVEGSKGPLLPNPNPSSDSKRQRRKRMRVVGTVMSAAGPHEWNVVFDFDGKSQVVNSRSLKIVPDGFAIPTHESTNKEDTGKFKRHSV